MSAPLVSRRVVNLAGMLVVAALFCAPLFIGLDGGMQLSVAIRTMVRHGNQVRLNAGSGIVADSMAEQEYEETMAKARQPARQYWLFKSEPESFSIQDLAKATRQTTF